MANEYFVWVVWTLIFDYDSLLFIFLLEYSTMFNTFVLGNSFSLTSYFRNIFNFRIFANQSPFALTITINEPNKLTT
jgi:hypothetical protein